MEQIVNLIITYAPQVATVLGYIYAGLIASRGLLTWIVTLTKTDKDNTVINALFAFLDKYGVDFKELEK
jgi:hypothetical protein